MASKTWWVGTGKPQFEDGKYGEQEIEIIVGGE